MKKYVIIYNQIQIDGRHVRSQNQIRLKQIRRFVIYKFKFEFSLIYYKRSQKS